MKIKKIAVFATVVTLVSLAASATYGYWISKVEAEWSLSLTRQAQIVLVSPVLPPEPTNQAVEEEDIVPDETAEDGEDTMDNGFTEDGESELDGDGAESENTLPEEHNSLSDGYINDNGHTEDAPSESGSTAESAEI